MKLFSFSVLLILCFRGTVLAQIDTTAYHDIFKKVQKQYAPDKRDIYFNIQFKRDSVITESSSAEVLKAFKQQVAALDQTKLRTELLPAAQLSGKIYGVTTISVANHRSQPVHGAELMTQTLLGTPLHILKKQGGFYLVRSPDGYLAWTDGGGVASMTAAEFNDWQKAKKIVFTDDYGHSYAEKELKSRRVSDLVKGDILKLLGAEGAFLKVAYPDHREAYVQKNQVTDYIEWVKRPNPKATDILQVAETLIGVPYLWGGTSIKGVDCSGFTKTAFFLNGIIIPRDASQQALVGKAVDVMENDTISVSKCLQNLQPGDLMFFSASKRRGTTGGRITHTAIYIGKGEFIQSAGMVKISSILPDAPNYDEGQTRTLVSARRMLTEIGTPKITRIDQQEWYK
ncbi:C40 family peptidase [Pedobacter sp.]|uniref:C40 family peptidase n=1 Tax=Pedobacter sp. TaxID=1411316 RepID=UPI00396CB56F